MHLGGEGCRSVANNKDVAALFENAKLPDELDVVLGELS